MSHDVKLQFGLEKFKIWQIFGAKIQTSKSTIFDLFQLEKSYFTRFFNHCKNGNKIKQ